MPSSEFSQEQIHALINRACDVVNHWETNKLATAVNQMRQRLMDLGCAADGLGHIHPQQVTTGDKRNGKTENA